MRQINEVDRRISFQSPDLQRTFGMDEPDIVNPTYSRLASEPEWKEYLDEIAKAIDAEGEWAEEYYFSPDYWGEYSYLVQENDYQEAEVGYEAKELYAEQFLGDSGRDHEVNDTEMARWLVEDQYADIEVAVTPGYATYDPGPMGVVLFTAPIDEEEVQLSDELTDRILSLDEESREYVASQVDEVTINDWDRDPIMFYVYNPSVVTFYLSEEDVRQNIINAGR